MPPPQRLIPAIIVLTGLLFALLLPLTLQLPKYGTPIRERAYSVDLPFLQQYTTTTTTTKTTSTTLTKDQLNSLTATAKQLSTTFLQSSSDASLTKFLDHSAHASSTKYGLFAMWCKSKAFWFLQNMIGWSRPDASSFLNKASLYVASENQFHAHLKKKVVATTTTTMTTKLLDVGSGTGTETFKLQKVLKIEARDVTCLESSVSMQSTLKKQGFNVAASFDDVPSTTKFTHASLLVRQ